MKKNASLYWICQIAGWFSYGLAIVFFAYILEKQLSLIFYPRLLITIILGIVLTHLFRKSMLKLSLRPPTPSDQWWKIFILILLFAGLFSILNSYLIELFKLFDRDRGGVNGAPSRFVFSLHNIISTWNGARVNKRILFSILLDGPIFLVWVSVYILWHYIEFTNSEEVNKVRLETIIKELELKTIKSQINPHFIFNALNSIRALVDEDPKRSRQAITELSNILRGSIQSDHVEITTLEKELNIVKDYLALEYIRFADRLIIEYEIESKTMDNELPPMMLQTLVENAIKHGLSKQTGDCTIKITSKFEQNKLVLLVQNTGLLNTGEKDGFGLQSTRERLNILYRGQALFELFQSTPNQVTAKLAIPISIHKK